MSPRVAVWFLLPADPRRIAADVRQMRLIRALERAADRAGIRRHVVGERT